MSTNRTRPDSGGADWRTLKRGPGGRFCCRFCGKEVQPPKLTFCSEACVHEWKLRTSVTYLRKNLFLRDKGVCARCGRDCVAFKRELWRLPSEERKARFKELKISEARRHLWDADHIVPVYKGGGECGLPGIQTLCIWCHKLKTKEDRQMTFNPEEPFQLFNGKSEEVLKQFPDNSIDALVTDPPAGISFMEREWDDAIKEEGEIEVQLPARASFVRWMTAVFKEVFRVLKPGAHGLVWALPRTAHWTTTALEDAGFDIRDVVTHHFGNGFPKNLNVTKAMVKAGEEAPQWEGWGTALKPATEHWILIRKPLDGTVVQNLLKHGTGAINIDGARIATKDSLYGGAYSAGGRAAPLMKGHDIGMYGPGRSAGEFKQPPGRFPANLLLSHSAECRKVGTRLVKTGTAQELTAGSDNNRQVYDMQFKALGRDYTYGEEGYEEIDDWECAADCPVARIDEQSGNRPGGHFPGVQNALSGRGNITTHSGGWSGNVPPKRAMGDEGGASRFFRTFSVEEPFRYEVKASIYDRNAGTADFYWKRSPERGSGFEPVSEIEWRKLEAEEERVSKERGERTILRARGNIHSTVKSVALMSWLTKLVAAPGALVLDCFMGSGTTGVAAAFGGLRFAGVEQDPDYFKIAGARIDYAKVRTSVISKLEAQKAAEPPPPPPPKEEEKPQEIRGIASDVLMKAIKKGLRRAKS